MNIFNWTSQPEKLAAWNQQLKHVDKRGNHFWYKNGQIHRDGDKPAVTYADGTKFWYKNDLTHRDGDKPAVTYADGTQLWYKNDQIHRDGDEPAVIGSTSGRRWYKNGRLVAKSQQEFNQWKAYENI